MAHGFLRDIIRRESNQNFGLLLSCIGGGFLLANSYVAQFLFNTPEHAALLAIAASVLLGIPLLYHAWIDLWDKRLEMNELAALSFIAAFATGKYQVAAVICFFMIVSQLIELRSQEGVRKNIEALMRLAPPRARRKNGDGFEEVEATELRQGDIVQVLPGANIPADGAVAEGFTTINEAPITGESLPVEKKPGDRVFAGTTNQSGAVMVEITEETKDSTLCRIRELIAQAETSKTPAMRLVDRYVSWYTPLILMLAGIVLFFTHDLSRAISMLVIACPCTILLSSPTALVAALGAAARLGVMVKSVAALESAARVDTVVFDKTGTLTTGKLALTDIVSIDGVSQEQLLAVAASIEQYSTHPVAKAIVGEAHKRNVALGTATEIEEKPGFGLRGKLDTGVVSAGRHEWCSADGTAAPATDSTASTVWVAHDNHLVGSLRLSDSVKPKAPAVLRELRSGAISHIVMLTGDRRPVAESVGNALGCAVKAEVLPEHKMTEVTKLREEGRVVAVVGDGVNDAPALAAGDVSIAMGAAGSDVAIHSASIVLMNDRLDRIPFVFTLARRVAWTIRQNLIFSVLYILVLLALSASGAIAPVLAVILHSLSSVFIVFNSARLLRVGEKIA